MEAGDLVRHELPLNRLDAAKPVLLHFAENRSEACRRTTPMIDEISQVFRDLVDVLKIDVVLSRHIADSFGIGEVPALVLLKGGTPLGLQSGKLSRRQIAEFLQSNI